VILPIPIEGVVHHFMPRICHGPDSKPKVRLVILEYEQKLPNSILLSGKNKDFLALKYVENYIPELETRSRVCA